MPSYPKLSRAQAHLWYVDPQDVSDPALMRAYHDLMAPEERRQHQRFVREKDRHTYLVTRALVRTSLARYAGVPPRDLAFECNTYGRPEIAGRLTSASLRFSVSHTDSLVACIFTVGHDIGLDVENTYRTIDWEAIARRAFSSDETAALYGLPPDRRRHRFFETWTLKEAYIKARGMGLSLPLDRFSVSVDGDSIHISFDATMDDDSSQWQFALLQPTVQHVTAVTIRRGEGPDLAIHLTKTVPLLEDLQP